MKKLLLFFALMIYGCDPLYTDLSFVNSCRSSVKFYMGEDDNYIEKYDTARTGDLLQPSDTIVIQTIYDLKGYMKHNESKLYLFYKHVEVLKDTIQIKVYDYDQLERLNWRIVFCENGEVE